MGACGSSESVDKTKHKNDELNKKSDFNHKYESQQKPDKEKQQDNKISCSYKNRR